MLPRTPLLVLVLACSGHVTGGPGTDAPVAPTWDAPRLPDGATPGGPDAPPGGIDAAPAACPAAALGARLGRDRLLVGGAMDDAAFGAAPFDVRYVYLAGDVPDPGPCASCASGCSASWWGCWQWDALPPGRYVADHITNAQAAGAVPMFSYYIWFSVAGNVEGATEIARLTDGARVARYLADWRFFMQVIHATTTGPVLVHIEPDLWGYGEQVSSDPATIPVALGAAGAPECASLPASFAGFARCMLAIARAEAPNALIGFHASAWGAGADALMNGDPGFDLAGHADRTAAFMSALGAADADLLVVEMSDRDAGFNGRWWDATNATLPDFDQALAWASRVAQDLGLAYLWWQIPYGHMGLPNTCDQYEDNRVDYFFDHAAELATAGALGIAFGAGASCQTTPASDGGHFVSRASAYFGGTRPCLCGSCP